MGKMIWGWMQGHLALIVVLSALSLGSAQFAPMLVHPFAGGFQIEGFVTDGTPNVYLTDTDFILRVDSGLIVFEQGTSHQDTANWFRDGDTLRTPASESPMAPCYGNQTATVPGGDCRNGVRAFYVLSETGATDAFVRIVSLGGVATNIGPMTFVVPTVRWVDGEGNPVTAEDLDLRTGTPVALHAQLIGLGDSVCTTCNAKLSIERDAGAEGLVFRNVWSQGGGLDSIIFQNGVANFLVGAETPVNSGAFSLTGLPDREGNDRINSRYPADINIVYPDGATLDSAWILDRDGDGWGDSVVGWFDRSLTELPDSLMHSWPRNGAWIPVSGSVALSTNRLSALITPSILQDTAAAGDLRAVVRTEGGTAVPSTAQLQNKIGPVLQTVTLLTGMGGAPDTLVAIFNKELDDAFVSGNAFLLNGSPLRVVEQGANGTTVRYTADPGVAQAGDSLRIAVNGGLVTADGNRPSANNRAVAIRPALRIPPLSDDGNGFWDRDGDGRMDSVTLEFLEPLTREMLDSLDLRFLWRDAQGRPVELRPPNAELVWSATNPTQVGWKVDPGTRGIQAGLTSIDSTYEYGYGVLIRRYEVNGALQADTLPISIGDRMAPVILQAWLDPESTRRSHPDNLRLTFSEAVDPAALENLDFLEFLVGDDLRLFDLSQPQWSPDSMVLDIELARGEALALRANPGDSLRSNGEPGGISDRFGNAMAISPWVHMAGNPRVLAEVVPMALATGIADDGPAISAYFHGANATLANVSNGRSVGVLLDIGMGSHPDSIGDLDLSAIGMRWKLMIFTNLGGHVATMSGEILCDDPGFSEDGESSGNCFEHRRKIYVGWNLRAEDGRKAGVGAYVAKFQMTAWGAQDNAQVDEIFTWGVRGGSNTRSLIP